VAKGAAVPQGVRVSLDSSYGNQCVSGNLLVPSRGWSGAVHKVFQAGGVFCFKATGSCSPNQRWHILAGEELQMLDIADFFRGVDVDLQQTQISTFGKLDGILGSTARLCALLSFGKS